MAPSHHHPDIVGNRDGKDMQGWTFPLPEDDTWSCDGTEESERGTPFETNTSFAQDHIELLAPPHPRSACFDGSPAPTIGTGDGDFSISTNDQEWPVLPQAQDGSSRKWTAPVWGLTHQMS